MPLDAGSLLSDAQAITSSANSTNTYDAGAPTRDVGAGGGLFLVLWVDQAFAASGPATLTPALVAADDAGLSTNPTTLGTWPAIPKAALVQGYRIALRVPRNPAFPRGQRYLGVSYTVASGPFTAGKISAALTDKPQNDAAVLSPRCSTRAPRSRRRRRRAVPRLRPRPQVRPRRRRASGSAPCRA